jgi:molybdenum cofactor biosynthesis protein MoaC
MIDISHKDPTLRTAIAAAEVHMDRATADTIRRGEVPKGNVFEVAKATAIQAVKNTSAIIPYCHPISITGVAVKFDLRDDSVRIEVSATAIDRTGVEVEAMTGASIAALVVYDMLKMIDETLSIGKVELVEKRGGKSDFKKVNPTRLKAAVLVLSDSIAAGHKKDLSGLMIRDRLEAEGLNVADYRIISDDRDGVVEQLCSYADNDRYELVITTGGTGFGSRDHVPEAMSDVVEREVPGIPEAARAHGQDRTPFSMLSRARAGIRGGTLIVNLPGSRGGVSDSLDALFPGLIHAFKMLRDEAHDHDPRPEVKK